MDPKTSLQHFDIYTCNGARKILCFHLHLRETRNELNTTSREFFLRKLQALIARLDKTKNELNRTKMEFSSIKLQATRNMCQVYYKFCIAILAGLK